MTYGRKKSVARTVCLLLVIILQASVLLPAASAHADEFGTGRYEFDGMEMRRISDDPQDKNADFSGLRTGTYEKEKLYQNGTLTKGSLPSSYDIRSYGYITSPESQNPNSNCWAFATSSCLESNILKKGYDEQLFSKSHLTYFTYTPASEGEYNSNPWSSGGSIQDAVSALSNLEGIAAESDYPNNYTAFTQSDRYNHDSGYIIESARELNSVEAVKSWIMNEGAVFTSMYSEPGSINFNQRSSVYNAFMLYSETQSTNHAITLIGWDDSVPASEFSLLWGHTPAHDGAWIIKNSWLGNSYDYMYLSYDAYLGDTYGLTAQQAGLINKNYTHAERFCLNYYSGSYIEFGEIYTATGNDILSQAGFWIDSANDLTDVTVTVRIYKNIPSTYSNPRNGTLAGTFSSHYSDKGYYNFTFPAGIEVDQGERFSVVISMQDSGGAYLNIPVEVGSNYNYGSKESYIRFSTSGGFYEASANGFGNIFMRCYSRPKSCSVHTWDEGTVTTQPGCLTQGTVTYTCSVCGMTQTETVAALGHNYVETSVPDCTHSGLTECSRCGVSEDIPPLGHNAVTSQAVPATCTGTGLTEGSYCSVCGEILEAQMVTAPLGHSFGSPVMSESGNTNHIDYTYTCSVCGAIRTDSYMKATRIITLGELIDMIVGKIISLFRYAGMQYSPE